MARRACEDAGAELTVDVETIERSTVIDRSARVALVAVALVCCGSEGEGRSLAPIPNTPPTLTVEVGTGFIDYVPLADGDGIEIVHGSQGGWHVWTGVKVPDASVQDVRINLFTRFADGGQPAGDASSVAASLGPTLDGARANAGMRNFITDGNTIHGKELVLRVEVVANDGRHGVGERRVVAQ